MKPLALALTAVLMLTTPAWSGDLDSADVAGQSTPPASPVTAGSSDGLADVRLRQISWLNSR
jgi:hypothetical protein